MGNHVFISHSHKDLPAAELLVTALEERGVACWVAPRDVPAGGSYAEALLNAIESASCFVLIYSEHSNVSSHVLREVERALKFGLNIVPVRFDESSPSKSLDYLLATVHWLAITPDARDRSIIKAVEQIAACVANSKAASPAAVPVGISPAPIAAVPIASSSKSPWLWIGGAILLAIAAGMIWFLAARNRGPIEPTTKSTPVPATTTTPSAVTTATAPAAPKGTPSAGTFAPADALPLAAGQRLVPGKKYTSSNGKFYLMLQADKNLVVRRKGDNGYVWGLVDRPGVDYTRTESARMTAAGKFEVVAASGTPIWSIPNNPVPGGVMTLSPDGTPHVSAPGSAETFKMPIPPGTTLQQGERYVSSDGKHFLIFQNDNNLAIYRAADKGFVWSLGDETPKVDFTKAAAVSVTDKSRFTVVDGADREIWGIDLISGTHLDIIDGILAGKNP